MYFCHIEYMSHVNWMHQYERKGKKLVYAVQEKSNVEWEREKSGKIEAKKVN